MHKYIPLEKIYKKDYKRKYKPWITHGILTSMKRRDKLLENISELKLLNLNQLFIINIKYLEIILPPLKKKVKITSIQIISINLMTTRLAF